MGLKEAFLSNLEVQLCGTIAEEKKSGKIKPDVPVDFVEASDRLIKAWKKNPITGSTIKALKMTDDDLRKVMKSALDYCEVKCKE